MQIHHRAGNCQLMACKGNSAVCIDAGFSFFRQKPAYSTSWCTSFNIIGSSVMGYMHFPGIWQHGVPEELPWCASRFSGTRVVKGRFSATLNQHHCHPDLYQKKGVWGFGVFSSSTDSATSRNNIFRAFWQKYVTFLGQRATASLGLEMERDFWCFDDETLTRWQSWD